MRRDIVALFLFLCAVALPAAADGRWGVEQLMAALAQVPANETRFVETRYLAMLDVPLKSTGTLSFTAPSRLEKHVLSPNDERYLVDGDSVLVENKAKGIRRQFPLQSYPAVWAFVQSFQATLTGNLEGLRRFYVVEFSGEQRRWELALKPRLPEMARMVAQMEIKGSDSRVATITIRERGGDYSVMRLEDGAK